MDKTQKTVDKFKKAVEIWILRIIYPPLWSIIKEKSYVEKTGEKCTRTWIKLTISPHIPQI